MNTFRVGVGQAHPIERVVLVPSGGGVFEVTLGGEVVFSKKKVGRHAEPGEVVELLRRRLE